MVVAAAVAVVLTLCLLQRSNGQQIINVNEDSNETIFLGSGVNFERDCFSPDPSSAVESFEWLLNGQPHSSVAGHLLVNEVTLQNTGEYSCRAMLLNGSRVGPISAGFLTVLDPDEHITAPARQHAILHGNTTLQCSTSLPNAVIVWSRNGGNVNAFISNITLESEGIYVCRVFLRDSNAGINIEVQLHVIVPPVIVSSPPAYQLITGNVPHNLTVIFQGSADAEVFSVMVSWYKDGSKIPDSRIETSSMGDVSDTERVTQLRFDPIRKVDRGVYRVEVEITLNDAERWRTEASFQLAIEVPPTPPANLEVVDITPTSARVTWDLTNQNTDAAADTLTVTLFHPNNQSVVCEHLLPGNRTDAALSLTPGLEYWVSVSAHNSDGTRTSQQVRFQSQPAAPSVSSLVIMRINETAFQLTAVLNYTGGGDITHFTVQFREIGTEIWGPSVEIPAIPSPDSSLVWNGVVVDYEFAGQPILEFNVSFVNTAMLESFHETTEFIVLPGPPLPPSLLSSSRSSLTIEVQLSSEGTPPIVEVFLEITNPLDSARSHNFSEPRAPGATVQFELVELSPDTEYTLVAYAVNIGGRGANSPAATFKTMSSSSTISLWLIVGIAVCASVVIVAVVIIVILFICYCCRHRVEENKYYTGSANGVVTTEEKKLEPTHEMLNRQHKGFRALSAGPLTPRSPTIPTSSNTIDSPYNMFHFETNSNNSDDSESTYPRYTYRVSPSPAEVGSTSMPSLTTRGDSAYSTHETLLSPPIPASYATDV